MLGVSEGSELTTVDKLWSIHLDRFFIYIITVGTSIGKYISIHFIQDKSDSIKLNKNMKYFRLCFLHSSHFNMGKFHFPTFSLLVGKISKHRSDHWPHCEDCLWGILLFFGGEISFLHLSVLNFPGFSHTPDSICVKENHLLISFWQMYYPSWAWWKVGYNRLKKWNSRLHFKGRDTWVKEMSRWESNNLEQPTFADLKLQAAQ